MNANELLIRVFFPCKYIVHVHNVQYPLQCIAYGSISTSYRDFSSHILID